MHNFLKRDLYKLSPSTWTCLSLPSRPTLSGKLIFKTKTKAVIADPIRNTPIANSQL